MITITLNNLNLSSGNYSVNTIQHDSGTPLNLNTIEVAREDGVKLISTNYGVKKFTIEGLVKGSTQSALEYNLDTFKKTISGTSLNLDIDYGYGKTRRYVVAVTNIAITREFFNLTFAPYSLEVEVQDPPFGQETSEEEVFSGSAFTNTTETFSCVFSGTAEPKPIIEMNMDTVGSLNEIQLKNNTTNTEMDIYTAWADSDIVKIDTANKTVQKNGQDVEFEGVFPECDLGINNFGLNFIISTSLMVDLSAADQAGISLPENWWYAQSFLGTAENYNKISLLLHYAYNPLLADVTVRIETNNSGKPSGTLVHANATATIPMASVGASLSWIDVNFNTFPLTATTYWVVIKCPSTNNLSFQYSNSSIYANGLLRYTYNNGSTWVDESPSGVDMALKIYKSTTPDWSIDTKINYTRRYL